MKTKVSFKEWKLEADKELTQQTYLKIVKASAESCGCNHCKNFAAQRDTIYPSQIKELLGQLGIDFMKETEISHFAKLKNGLHYYSGWFHFKGTFTGNDCTVPFDGGYTYDLTPITDNFSIGFRHDNLLTHFKNKKNLVQIDFGCQIPWVIEKELETD